MPSKKPSSPKPRPSRKKGNPPKPLAEYERKRRASKTPEPSGITASSPSGHLFVIQKHDATRLHYDFRLELDGVLKSWAVPKGPSLDPAEKRLAVEVEDHPVAYGDFEGIIPKGEYGGGTVLLWDQGEWAPQGPDPMKEIEKGSLKIVLQGQKLKGNWALVRMKPRPNETKAQWLLIKERDQFVRRQGEYDVLEALPNSVKTGRSLEEIAADPVAVWTGQGNGNSGAPPTANVQAQPFQPERLLSKLKGAVRTPPPKRWEVSLARTALQTPNGAEWIHEIKLDGYRILCELDDGNAKLWTRRHQDWTARFGSIARTVQLLPVRQAVLDGEIVALDAHGVSNFSLLQSSGQEGRQGQLVYFAFDLLYLNGYDLRHVRLIERKELLRQLVGALPNQSRLQWLEHFSGDGPEFFRQCCKLGLEGTISKRIDKRYIAGRRGDWLKSKCILKDELLIGGYTDSTTTRRGFGALLLGYRDKEGNLQFAGHVGTGFSESLLSDLKAQLQPLRTDESPFANLRVKPRGTHWVRPTLVVSVAFQSWTKEGVLRHPSFRGLEEDKTAEDVGIPKTLNLNEVEETSVKSTSRSPKSRRTVKKKVGGSDPAATPREVAGIRITHPDRVLYASQGISKLGLIDYYLQVSEQILPYISNRPLSLVRCPSGQQGSCFYQKHAMPGMPEALERIQISENKKKAEYLMVQDAAGLVALVQFGVLEIHPWGSTADALETPDRLIFDLDPGPNVPWTRVLEAAREIHERFSKLKLESFVKTTGGKGLHVVIPIRPKWEWPEIKTFCGRFAEQMEADSPKEYTTSISKAKRTGKILIDYYRNDRGATAVAAYSTRARPGAPVSVPVAWDELSAALTADRFHVASVLSRLEHQSKDPWQSFWSSKQSLTAAIYRKIAPNT